MRWVCSALLGCLLAAVAGCALFEDKPRLPCPNFLLLGDAEDMTRFRPGPGRDITDIEFRAAITNFGGTCSYDKDAVRAKFFVQFGVQRGPANRSREAQFEYFVAIPRFHPSPAGKKIFPIKVTFEENQTRVIYRDEVSIKIPLAKGESGANYDVYLGFQLDAEQVEYNRRRRSR